MRRAGRGSRVGTRLLIASLALCSVLVSSARANVVADPVTGQKFGILPVPQVPIALNRARPLARIAAAGTPTCDQSVDSQCATPLTYHGGPVQHAENIILFFWDPSSFSSNRSYVTDMQNWVNGLTAGDFSTGTVNGSAVGNPISVTQEYYDMSGPGGTKSFVPYAVHNGGTVFDTDPYPSNGCTDTYTDANNQTVTLPKCLNSGQLFGELHSFIQEHKLPLGIDTEYFVLTPQGIGTCQDSLSHSCAYAQYCAWHVGFGSPSNLPGQVILADLPWLAGTPCDPTQSPSSPSLYSSGINRVVDAFSHELAETMTDPDISGWYGAGGDQDEIGDKCESQYSVGQPMDVFTRAAPDLWRCALQHNPERPRLPASDGVRQPGRGLQPVEHRYAAHGNHLRASAPGDWSACVVLIDQRERSGRNRVCNLVFRRRRRRRQPGDRGHLPHILGPRSSHRDRDRHRQPRQRGEGRPLR